MEAASTQRKNLVRSLDPRMKLLLVVVISTATMFTPSREVVAWNYIIIILLWLISGEVRHCPSWCVAKRKAMRTQERKCSCSG